MALVALTTLIASGSPPVVAQQRGIPYFSVEIPLSGASDLLVDLDNERVLVAGGPGSTQVALLDFDGNFLGTVDSIPSPYALVKDGTTIYVSNHGESTVTALDARTLGVLRTYDVAPLESGEMALAGGKLWLGDGCHYSTPGLGSLDPETGEVIVWHESGSRFPYGCRGFNSAPGQPDLLMIWEKEQRGIGVWDIVDGAPVKRWSNNFHDSFSSILDVAVSPEKETFVVADTYELKLHGLSDSSFIRWITYAPAVGADFSPRGDEVAVAYDSRDSTGIGGFRPHNRYRVWYSVMPGARRIPPGTIAYAPDGEKVFFVSVGTGGRTWFHIGGPGAPPDPYHPGGEHDPSLPEDLTPFRASDLYELSGAGAGGAMTWTQSRHPKGDGFQVWLRRPNGRDEVVGSEDKVGDSSDIHGKKVAYQFRTHPTGYNSKIRIYHYGKKTTWKLKAANTPHFEFLPQIHGRWVLFGRTVADGKRYISKVILLNRRSGQKRTLAKTWDTDVALRPMEAKGRYMSWDRCIGNNCKSFRYDRRTKSTKVLKMDRLVTYAPALTLDGTVFAATSGLTCGEEVSIRRFGSGFTQEVLSLPAEKDILDMSAEETGGRTLLHISLYDCMADDSDVYTYAVP